MRNFLFTINKKNAFDIITNFGLNEYDTDYIFTNFWPIIVLKETTVSDFQNLLKKEKTKFENNRGEFILSIFKREELDYLIYELKDYLDNLKQGETKIYKKINDTYFHWFKLKLDTNSYTLLLSNKDKTGLEIFFNDLLACINNFISENEATVPVEIVEQNPVTEQPETLSSIITNSASEDLVNGLKIKCKNIKGKRLKLLLIALQELELLPKERIAKKFHTLCEKEFDWHIASYNAMNGYEFNPRTDIDEVEGMKDWIKKLLNTK
jgi:hypothetical protein